MGNVDPKVRTFDLVTNTTFSLDGIAEWTIFEAGSTITAISYVVNGTKRGIGFTVTDEFHYKPAGAIAEGLNVEFSAGQPVIAFRRFISG